MRALLPILALLACGPKYPGGIPTITATGIAKGKTFLFNRVEVVEIGPRTSTLTFSAEETLAEGSGNVVSAMKLHVLDGGRKDETGDVTQDIGWAPAGTHLVVRAREKELEIWSLPEGTVVPSELDAGIRQLYAFVGRDDPFLANIPPRALAVRGRVEEHEAALRQYLTTVTALASVESVRAIVTGIRDPSVSIHADVTGSLKDDDCVLKGTIGVDLTLRRHGGDLAHLEAKGSLSGACGKDKAAGSYRLTVDRSPR